MLLAHAIGPYYANKNPGLGIRTLRVAPSTIREADALSAPSGPRAAIQARLSAVGSFEFKTV